MPRPPSRARMRATARKRWQPVLSLPGPCQLPCGRALYVRCAECSHAAKSPCVPTAFPSAPNDRRPSLSNRGKLVRSQHRPTATSRWVDFLPFTGGRSCNHLTRLNASRASWRAVRLVTAVLAGAKLRQSQLIWFAPHHPGIRPSI